jgi:type III secretion system OrgA/MxiK family protein
MSLQRLTQVMYAPASYADPHWLAKVGCRDRHLQQTRNRLLIHGLVLDGRCDPQWLKTPRVAELVANWSQLVGGAWVLGLLALKPQLLRSGYLHRLSRETLALLALPISLPVLLPRPSTLDRQALIDYGAGYVLALAQGIPAPLQQRLMLLFPVREASVEKIPVASTHFVFRLAVEHVKKYRIEVRDSALYRVDQAQGYPPAAGQRGLADTGENAYPAPG